MWARQVQGCSAEVIEEFFTGWMAHSRFMPAFSDFTEWIEARNALLAEEKALQEYAAYQRSHVEQVRQWKESPEYARDMEGIRQKLQTAIATAPKPKPKLATVIPLAFSPEKEREILAGYAAAAKERQ
jgi:hypothetical protein